MIVVHVVEPFATGINTFIQELVFGMPDYQHIIIHGERKDTRNIESIKSEYLNKAQFINWENAHREISLKMDFKACVELRKILKKIDYDVLHLHSSKAGVIGRLILNNKSQKKVIYTPNGASFLRNDIPENKINQYNRIEKFFSRFKSTIVSSSKTESDAYQALKIKTTIIENGTLVHNDLNKKENKTFQIVTCGKITIQKNPLFLNRIATFFKENNKNVSFKWIGDGELKHELSNVEITGWCSKKEVYQHLNNADLYISTSSWEGLPFAGIEAMAFGLPLLMSDCVGNNNLVNQGINGYIFNSKVKAIDQISFLMGNRKKLNYLSDNSTEIYHRHYNNYRCANDYNKLYKEICRKANNVNG